MWASQALLGRWLFALHEAAEVVAIQFGDIERLLVAKAPQLLGRIARS